MSAGQEETPANLSRGSKDTTHDADTTNDTDLCQKCWERPWTVKVRSAYLVCLCDQCYQLFSRRRLSVPDEAERVDGLRLVPASRIRPAQVEWVWCERIPRGLLTLLMGSAGLGKTTLSCELSARVTRGQLGSEPAPVIIATAEDSLAHTLVPRLSAAGADLDLVHFVSMVADGVDGGLTLPDDTANLEQAVTDKGAALLVLDPVVAHLSGALDTHKDHSVRRALGPLHALAERTSTAVVGIAHLNKSMSSDALTRLSGSIGFGAAARSVLLLATDPARDDSPDRLLAHVKSNVGPHAPTLRFRLESRTVTTDVSEIETSGFAWLGEDTSTRVADMLVRPQSDPDRSERDIAREVIQDALGDGARSWVDLVDLVEEEGASDRTARRARTELQQEGVIERRKVGMRGGWFWHLATEVGHETPNLTTDNGWTSSAPGGQVQKADRSLTAAEVAAEFDGQVVSMDSPGQQAKAGGSPPSWDIGE